MPHPCRISATRTALMELASQPIRIFAVTGNGATALHYRFGDAAECGTIFQQSGAAIFRDHFVNRAAKVQVDEIRAQPNQPPAWQPLPCEPG